jgi:hypothetical protein
VTPGRERPRTGLATVGSPHLPDAVPKAARALWTTSKCAQAVGPSRSSLKIGFEVPKHLLMTRHQGVQSKPVANRSPTGSPIWACQSLWNQFTARIAVKRVSTLNRNGSSLTRKMDCR